ncbi:MAG: hypothetical protein KKA64_01235 [Nanoarchaeota archaeon]|nr:hypothetical protein [Nanoarchaeota archaeon]
MGLFGLGKRKEVIDLSEGYKRKREAEEQRRVKDFKKDKEEDSLNFLGKLASGSDSDNESGEEDSSLSAEERRKRLTKRLLNMTNRMEDLSNQVYHLKQRVELLEKKLKISKTD